MVRNDPVRRTVNSADPKGVWRVRAMGKKAGDYISDLSNGATDGYCGNWMGGEAVPQITPDMTVLGGKKQG